MDNQFDKSALSMLIKKALGNRTQKSFAQDAQLSKEHLSRLITKKRDTPPTVDTLVKIASNSQSRVSLQELIFACGYDPNKITVPATVSHMIDALTHALSGFPYKFSFLPCNSTDFYQMILQFTDGPVHRWYFHFLQKTTFSTIDHELETNLLQLISKKTASEDKISFVTSIPLVFQYYMEHRPYNLDMNLSFILVNEHAPTVSKETLLQTSNLLSDNILNNYTLPLSPV